MRLSLPRAALAALVLPFAAASCSSDRYPASPVPAAQSDLQAMRMSQLALAEHGTPPGTFTDATRTGEGHFIGYKTDLDPTRQPPREYHLIVVNNDGTMFDQVYRRDR